MCDLLTMEILLKLTLNYHNPNPKQLVICLEAHEFTLKK